MVTGLTHSPTSYEALTDVHTRLNALDLKPLE